MPKRHDESVAKEGPFTIVKYHSRGKQVIQVSGWFQETINPGDKVGSYFNFEGKVPSLPFLFAHIIHDDYYNTEIVVDQDRTFWVGGQVSTRQDAENQLEYSQHWNVMLAFREALGMKPKLQPQARWALENGWTPPLTFNVDDYED